MARGRIDNTPKKYQGQRGPDKKKRRGRPPELQARPGNQFAVTHGLNTEVARGIVGSIRKLREQATRLSIMDANSAAAGLVEMEADLGARITALENVYAHFAGDSEIGIEKLYTLVQKLLNTRMLVIAKLADLAANKELHEREVARARELSDVQAEQQVLEYMLSTEDGRKRVLKVLKENERLAKQMKKGPTIEPLGDEDE
jgi:hypothetical protein